MAKWRLASLGDLSDILDSQRIPVREEDRPSGSVPYYGANGQQGWIDRPLFDESLILLAEDGGHFDDYANRPIAYRIDGPSWVNNHAHVLRAATGVDQSYLFWSLRNKDIRRWIAGGTRSKLTRGEMEKVEIMLPPLEDQRRIAEILDTIDETIQATERIIAKLREAQKGLLQRLLPEGLLVHETANRALPEGWHYRTIDEIAINHDGRRIPIRAEDRLERRGPYPYYGASGVIDHIDDYLFDGTYVLLGEDGENVLSRSTPLSFVVTGRSWVNNHAHVFEARAEVDSRFLALVLERTDYAGIASGSAQPKITQSGLRQMRFPMPRHHIQTDLRDRMQSIENSLASEIRHTEGLESVRVGLASDLLSGRVRTVAA